MFTPDNASLEPDPAKVDLKLPRLTADMIPEENASGKYQRLDAGDMEAGVAGAKAAARDRRASLVVLQMGVPGSAVGAPACARLLLASSGRQQAPFPRPESEVCHV